MKKWSVIFSQVMRKRGLSADFLEPRYEELSDPFLLPDMEVAVERILRAGREGEKVVVYGDYDVDGVCASTVMREALMMAGVSDVVVMLPDRFVDGYGLNVGVVTGIVETGASLVVTVDCGSSNGEVITELLGRGVEVIVTDHHEVFEVPDVAVAVVNPKREGENWACLRGLSGVGVAFMVARAVNMRLNGGVCDGQEKWLLDLVAVGTVCDSMELLGENRILVSFGMKVLAKTRRVGLRELMKLAGVEKMRTQAIGFQIGPRLNASGRMSTARKSLGLLMATGRAEGFALAKELDGLNRERKRMQDRAISEIEGRGVGDCPVILVQGDCHEGIIGIVAGRLCERYRRPSFVLTEIEGGMLKGSGRSFGDFSLADCITHCRNMLVAGGGHNYACGVTIAKSDFSGFAEAVNTFYMGLGLKNQERFLRVVADVVVEDLDALNEELIEEINCLEPFGQGNAEPIFGLTDVLVMAVGRMGEEGKHLRLEVRGRDGRVMKLVGFFAREEWFKISEGEKICAMVNLELNEWRGVRSVEGRILSIERTGEMC